jgi:hypothetical protein
MYRHFTTPESQLTSQARIIVESRALLTCPILRQYKHVLRVRLLGITWILPPKDITVPLEIGLTLTKNNSFGRQTYGSYRPKPCTMRYVTRLCLLAEARNCIRYVDETVNGMIKGLFLFPTINQLHRGAMTLSALKIRRSMSQRQIIPPRGD